MHFIQLPLLSFFLSLSLSFSLSLPLPSASTNRSFFARPLYPSRSFLFLPPPPPPPSPPLLLLLLAAESVVSFQLFTRYTGATGRNVESLGEGMWRGWKRDEKTYYRLHFPRVRFLPPSPLPLLLLLLHCKGHFQFKFAFASFSPDLSRNDQRKLSLYWLSSTRPPSARMNQRGILSLRWNWYGGWYDGW